MRAGRADRSARSCRGRRPSTTTTAISAASRRPQSCTASPAHRSTARPTSASIERGLRDHLARSLTIELPVNTDLKLYGRPGESPTDFAARCDGAADDRAGDGDRHAARQVRGQGDAASATRSRRRGPGRRAPGRGRTASATTSCCRPPVRSWATCSAGARAAGRCGRSARRLDGTVAQPPPTSGSTPRKARSAGCTTSSTNLETELTTEIAEIDARWQAVAERTSTISVGLERTDVQVTGVVLAWMPVA